MSIEKERAKRRQAEQAKQNQPQAKKTNDEKSQKREPVPTSEKKEKERARDTVGEKVGVSGKTAEQSAFCVRVMDALEEVEMGIGGVTLCYFFALSFVMFCLDDHGGSHKMATQRRRV
jgi:hypothetical protein